MRFPDLFRLAGWGRLALSFTICCAWLAHAAAEPTSPRSTRPVEGLREHAPRTYALTGARLVVAPGQVLERGVLVVRDERIEAVGPEAAIPADARVIDAGGAWIYPGLIDAASTAQVEGQPWREGAPYWNEQVRPQFSLAEHYQPAKGELEKLRAQGVVARLIAPRGGVLRGTSSLIWTGEQEKGQALLAANVAQHLTLSVRAGGDREQYPRSPMGAVALARQAFYDAQWYAQAAALAARDPQRERPEPNDALAALAAAVEQRKTFIIDAQNELYFLRADAFAREFDLNLIVRGSGYEYRRLEAIRNCNRPVLLPVRFPQPPEVATAESARSASLTQLLHWDLAPENPARLAGAGVRFAFSSHGLDDLAQFLPAIRIAVARGLSSDTALAALTTTPAELLGVASEVGTLAAGKSASFLIASGDLFDERTKILETWVAGRRFEFVPQRQQDVRGQWRLAWKGQAAPGEWIVQLGGEPGQLSGEVRVPEVGPPEPEAEAVEEQPGPPEPEPPPPQEKVALKHLGLRDSRLSGVLEARLLGRAGLAQLSAVISWRPGMAAAWEGTITWPDGARSEFTAQRMEEHSPAPAAAPEKREAAAFEVNYPLGPFGRSNPPEQNPVLLLRGGVLWTCGPEGVLENASLLVQSGRIQAVGAGLEPPEGAVVIDLAGQHVTPGLIDCHSHMATDGGVNEGTQAVTAEVRIGDFIDSDDIDIYRQLAGGVTSVNVLHGSANPIGGQNQVLKLRWGALPEEMKFAGAPAGIKFALGENVKQSNWGERFTSRYPQTRMGVEQLMRDAFEAARDYGRKREAFAADPALPPVRRELELDALAEVLGGQRWIHCHSYRQDEIVAFLRLCEEYGVQVGTLQHVLEGYKAASELARHGAMASSFSDWWAYKFEVFDAIPYNGALLHEAGVVVSFNSDDQELARHLNHEAAKAVKYGGVPPAAAFQFVTLNPARQLRIDDRVGSLTPGKDADFVVWSGSPLSTLSRCEQTWIDGRKYFDRAEDQAARHTAARMRTALVQRILRSGQAMRPEDQPESDDDSDLWPRTDEFCHAHGHH